MLKVPFLRIELSAATNLHEGVGGWVGATNSYAHIKYIAVTTLYVICNVEGMGATSVTTPLYLEQDPASQRTDLPL